MNEAVGVLGAGRWGTALAQLAAMRGAEVVLWDADADLAARIDVERANRTHLPQLDRLHDRVRATADPAEVAGRCRLILLAVQAAELRPVLLRLAGALDGSHVLVHTVRALEPESLETPSQVVTRQTCVRKVGALLGPMVVDAIFGRRPSAAVLASRYPEAVRLARAALSGDALRIYDSRDLEGVETAGAAAGALALAVGICLELGLGAATLAVLTTRGVAEMARLCRAAGGEERTAFGLAGLGNLVVQREGESREVRAGRLLARGASVSAIEAELGHLDALDAVRTFGRLAKARGVEAPIVTALGGILGGGLSVAEALAGLMSREQPSE